MIHNGMMRARINHVSWWEREMPSEKEFDTGRRSLADAGNKVDIILSHCAPSSTAILMGFRDLDPCKKYLEEVRQNTNYKRLYFGHYHKDMYVNDRDMLTLLKRQTAI